MPQTLINFDQLSLIMPLLRSEDAERYLPLLNAALEEFQINTPPRITAFIAQLAHESAQLRYFEELASGAAYEGRQDLGNTEPGDGHRFKGRGPIQLTGRANYKACGDYLGLDLISKPTLASSLQYAFRVAGWFWTVKEDLNPLADAGDFRKITKRINGGYNGYDSRCLFYARAKQALAPKPARPVLRMGAVGPDVKDLQSALVQLGYLPKSAVSARFGSDTTFAVQAFQKAAHLKADAIVGPATWAALNQAISKKG